jgi:hypothetical protein
MGTDVRFPFGEHPAGEFKLTAQEATAVGRFTAKLFCNVEFWIERLRKLIGSQPESGRSFNHVLNARSLYRGVRFRKS